MTEDEYINKLHHPQNDSPLEMVGRKGDHNLDWFASYIIGLLEIAPGEDVLDLCCGNGLVTHRVAREARHLTGVDYSRLLLEQARSISNADNITYLEGDARSPEAVLVGRLFHKAYISAAFQYFDAQTGKDVLLGLRRVITPGAKVAILDVPDRARKMAHMLRAARRLFLPDRAPDGGPKRFPTLHSRLAYLGRNAAGAVGIGGGSEMGFWWSRAAFRDMASECGFACATLLQPPENPHHSYRFDAVLDRLADSDGGQPIVLACKEHREGGL